MIDATQDRRRLVIGAVSHEETVRRLSLRGIFAAMASVILPGDRRAPHVVPVDGHDHGTKLGKHRHARTGRGHSTRRRRIAMAKSSRRVNRHRCQHGR